MSGSLFYQESIKFLLNLRLQVTVAWLLASQSSISCVQDNKEMNYMQTNTSVCKYHEERCCKGLAWEGLSETV